jgi:acetylornithine/succinyldiaminopimelate/putrescine aminotransferase
MTKEMVPPEISHATGSFAWASDGQRFTDLMIGFGAVFLGHVHPHITRRLQDQVSRVWLCGRCPTPVVAEAEARINELLPSGFRLGGLYSTGMEVVEFAMRLAAHHSGRREFAGFARSMHGKSAITASLCWNNAPIRPELVHTIPFVDTATEDEILGRLSLLLGTGRIAALFVEPIQGSNQGHEASAAFYHRVIALCRENGTYCVFDEILTGLYRTGSAFYVDRLATRPDFLLFAKSMANGFPVSSIAIPADMAIAAPTLPGSTYSGNPLAAAAVAATLEVMHELPMTDQVAAIERTIRDAFGGRGADGLTLRGRGALWVLELDKRVRLTEALVAIRERGVLVSSQGRHIRILPAATIDLELLREACGKIVGACASAYT